MFVLFSSKSSITGKELASKLDCKSSDSFAEAEKHASSGELVVGWGKSVSSTPKTNSQNFINHPGLIHCIGNKFDALNIMNEKGVSVPDTISLEAMAPKPHIALEKPLLARAGTHSMGIGAVRCLYGRDINFAKEVHGATHATAYICSDREYRIHVLDDKVVLAQKKVLNPNPKKSILMNAVHEIYEEEQEIKKWTEASDGKKNEFHGPIGVAKKIVKHVNCPDIHVRSHNRGWMFSTIDKAPIGVKSMARAAVKALGLHAGAVDLCIDYDGNIFVFEVNTAPHLSGKTLDKWIVAIQKYAKAKGLK